MSNQRAHRYNNSTDSEYESKVARAIELCNNKVPIAQAAREVGLPRTTISGRLSGRHKSRDEAYNTRRLITSEAEKSLLSWMDKAAQEGKPYDNEQIRTQVAILSGKDKVGKNWPKRFLERHPELTKNKGNGLDPSRGKNFNPTTVSEYYDILESIYGVYGPIPAEHVWNMDEKGIQMGGGRTKGRRKYYYFRDRKNRYRIKSDNLELVTVIECASAAGALAPASFILKQGRLPNTEGIPDVGDVNMTDSGWTDRDQAVKWVKEQFIPTARANRTDTTKPVVLTIDGHDSHESDAIKTAIYESAGDMHIIVICFPSKCTHKLQPLDVGVFSQVQNKWASHCEDLILKRIDINRHNVVPEYMKVRRKVITPDLIKKAFRKTGIYPLDRNVFINEDFAPSHSFSSMAHMPDGFPEYEVPSSDPAVPTDVEDDSSDFEYLPPSDPPDVIEESRTYEINNVNNLQAGEDDLPDDYSFENLATQDDSSGSSTVEMPLEPLSIDELISNQINFPVVLPEDLESFNDTGISQRHMSRSLSRSLSKDLEEPLRSLSYRTLQTLSNDELIEHVLKQQSRIHALSHTVNHLQANVHAVESHCTLAQMQINDLRADNESLIAKTRRNRKPVKVRARVVTAPHLREQHYRDLHEREEHEREVAAQEALKVAAFQENDRRLNELAISKVFNRPFTSFKKKEDFIVLARALSISDAGTIAQLSERIKTHFADNPRKLQLPRFRGLSLSLSDRRAMTSTSQPHAPLNLSATPDASTSLQSSDTPNSSLPYSWPQYQPPFMTYPQQ